jgi:glycosyltransferase involved in cell wall biosynthesis
LKILVVTPRFAISGVPLAQARFAAALAEAGHTVTFIVGNCDPDLTVPEAPGVHNHVLGAARVLGMAPALYRHFRQSQPDVVFSAEDHLNCVVLAMAAISGSRARISGSSRVTPFDTYSSVPFTKRWWLKQAMRALAWRAQALTCVSQDMVAQYRTLFPRMGHTPVYNIVDYPAARARLAEPLDDPWFADGQAPPIVAAGSLAPWKGFADLIRAMALLDGAAARARLVILGEGPLRSELEALISELGLGARVRLPGRVANPLKWFARARVFALSSHVEGMPNVLVEAMLAGCTPVATDCPTGPAELLADGRYGYLVRPRDPADLARGIQRALAHPIAQEILDEAIAPFEESRVIARHFALLGLQLGTDGVSPNPANPCSRTGDYSMARQASMTDSA